MITSRRGFLVGLGALIAVPALVRASSLMPLRGVSITPQPGVAFGEPTIKGLIPCDGRVLYSRDYPKLFAAIGNAHGDVGPGMFKLPDFRGSVSLPGSKSAPPLQYVSIEHQIITGEDDGLQGVHGASPGVILPIWHNGKVLIGE